MIAQENGVFWLDTAATSYVFRVTAHGHLEHLYYGRRLPWQNVESLAVKRTAAVGSSVVYDPSDPLYCMDTLCLEWSGTGVGDFRFPPAELKMPDGGFSHDMVYIKFEILHGPVPMETLPCARGEGAQTLAVFLRDEATGAELTHYYTVFEETDVIARRCVLTNRAAAPLHIRKLMSLCVDLPNDGFSLTTFDGGWIREAHRHDRVLQHGCYVNSSITGASSNRHNPGFLLSAAGCTEEHGSVYGFNLIYSGNHCGVAERSANETVRVCLGINPHCFEWELGQGESFETPQAVMTYSHAGFNGMSGHFHDFVNAHIVPETWQGRERPVLFNSWEACFFNFTQRKLLRMAKIARGLGAELFVLDDGWFGARDSDTAGLGDYTVNRKKLPGGLEGLAGQLSRIGLAFGLWFEPEMVNEDSDLYRAHPDWIVKAPGRIARQGRNQFVLDLCKPEVRDYIVENVSNTLDRAGVSYVKWDMNRHMGDAYSDAVRNSGEFFHRYILGLYEVLTRIFKDRPGILLETCSSGGNRFDLGMLCFSPQVWASDCTDPVERLAIQGGLSYLYPPSAMGAHVSDAPHQQTLRDTPLSTRFNVAAFGVLGYELDARFLTAMERAEIREQIAFYKKHRKTLQFGRFRRVETPSPNRVQWQAAAPDGTATLTLNAQTLAGASPGRDALRVPGLAEEGRYRVRTKPQRVYIKRFGGLLKHVMPFALNPNGVLLGLVHRLHALPDCAEEHTATGAALAHGIELGNQFMGTWYNPETRLLGDFGSNLYVTEEVLGLRA